MRGRLPDVLAELPLGRRLARERADGEYLLNVAKHLRPAAPGDAIDVLVCARIDLDHPLYFPDNRFCDCGDCGCGLQHRPDIPAAGDRICVCCAARRMRGAVRGVAQS